MGEGGGSAERFDGMTHLDIEDDVAVVRRCIAVALPHDSQGWPRGKNSLCPVRHASNGPGPTHEKWE